MNENVGRHSELFQEVDFTGHSGDQLHWKIEMDVLHEREWECIARMIMEYTKPFGEVVGIPRGGLKLSSPLEKYATNDPQHPLLIVDDVLTTGGSMEHFCEQYFRNREPRPYIGWVVFARAYCPSWVKALFQMPETLKVDYRSYN